MNAKPIPTYCLWLINPDYLTQIDIYETSCGNSFTFNDGGPTENDFEFCPYCGMAIKTGEE